MSVRSADPSGLQDLLFSLASDDRLALLDELSARRQRLTALSKVIGATVQECSRHVERLGAAGLVSRDSEGFYATTSLGRAVLKMLPAMRFLLSHRDYSLSHDPGFLPDQFVERLGELSAGRYVAHVSETLELIKKILSEAKEFVYLVADQPPIVSKVAGSSFTSKEIPVRLIGEKVDKRVASDLKAVMPNSQVVLMKDVRVALAMNESQAGICLPDLKGRPDFSSGFEGRDPAFLIWCRDLFEHYWAESHRTI